MEEFVKFLAAARDTGITGIFGFLAFMWWTERKDRKVREEALVQYAVALAKLTDAINNFHKNCLDIQRSFQREVDRMSDKND